jgi:hypothetical protein
MLHLLKNGRADEALESLHEYEGKKSKDGVVNPYTYITNNRNKVDYPAYKSQDLYIGSGPIESGNKVVVQKRCKQAGQQSHYRGVRGNEHGSYGKCSWHRGWQRALARPRLCR